MAILGVSFPVFCVLLVCIARGEVLIVSRVLVCQGPVFCVILIQGSSKKEERYRYITAMSVKPSIT